MSKRERSKIAKLLGSIGGKVKNPKKGFGSLSKKRRSEIAKAAAAKRWGQNNV